LVTDELVARYDAEGREVGVVRRSRVYAEGLWHACAGVLLRSADGSRVLVHRRVQSKAVFAGLHDCVAGGVLAPGEDFAGAAARELGEELGVHDVELHPLDEIAYDDGRWRYHLVVFEARSDGPLVLQPDEVAEAWWWTPAELRAHLADPAWPFVPDTRALLQHLDTGAGW
jgi:isopentenyldiphosphate isomerase